MIKLAVTLGCITLALYLLAQVVTFLSSLFLTIHLPF